MLKTRHPSAHTQQQPIVDWTPLLVLLVNAAMLTPACQHRQHVGHGTWDMVLSDVDQRSHCGGRLVETLWPSSGADP